MSVGAVIVLAALVWLLLAAVVALVLGWVIRNRDEQRPTSHRGGRARKDSRLWPHTRGH